MNPNAVYYLVKSSDSNQSNTSRSITPNSNGEKTSTTSAKDGIDLILKIDNGSGLPGATVAVMHLSQYYPPSLVINPGSTVCAGDEVVVLAQYIGDTYTENSWTVTTQDGSTPTKSYDPANHTLTLTGITAGTYIVKLDLGNGEFLTTNFTAINAQPYNRPTFKGCWDEFQVNATLPEGFSGTWTGDGVVDIHDPKTVIKNPNGDYFWTAKNGSCEFQETWTFENSATGLSDIVVTQTGNCGSATLTVTHKKGVSVKWVVDGVETSATSGGDTKSTLTLTAAGTHSVKVTAGEGSDCKVEKNTSITVSSLDGFDSTPEGPIVICSGSSTQLGPAPTVDGADKQYWTPSGTTVTILPNSTSNTVTVSGLAEGSTSTMTWTVEKDGCKASKVYTIQNGSASVTGSDDKLICGNNNSTTIGISYTGNKTVKWVKVGDDTWESPTDNYKQITVSDIPEGTTTYRAYVWNNNTDENNNKVAYGCVTVNGSQVTGDGVVYTDIKVTRVVATASALPNSVCSTDDNITLKGSSLSEAGVGATGYWTASGGTITSNSTSNEAMAKISGAGTATFIWHVVPVINLKDGTTFSCTAEAATSVTYGGGGAEAVTVGEFCGTNNTASISVGANSSNIEPTTVQFVPYSGAVSADDITKVSSTEATVKNLPNGTTEIRWTAKTKSGCTLQAIIPIYNLDPPAPTASTVFVCDYKTDVTLTAEPLMTGATGTWSKAQGDAELVVDPNSANIATLHFAGSSKSGVNIITWQTSYKTPKIGLECKSEVKRVTVENLAITANAGNDFEICNYENNVLKDEQNTATLKASSIANYDPAAEGKWTRPDGTSTDIEKPTSNETKVTNLASGINKFTWTVTRTSSVNSNNKCSASSDVIVYNSRVDAADAGAAIYVCDDYATLRANSPSDGEGKWTLQSGHGYFTKAVDVAHSVYEKTVTVNNVTYLAHADVYQRAGSMYKTYEYQYYTGNAVNANNIVVDNDILAAIKEEAGDFANQIANNKGTTTEKDTPIGTHEVYESEVINYEDSPYIGQNFLIRADKYTYSYNGTSDIVYTYYLLNGSDRSIFSDGNITSKLLEMSNSFTETPSRRISTENLYDDTYALDPKVVRLQAGDNTFRWSVSRNLMPNGNGCSNFVDAHVYYIPVKVDAGTTQHLCQNYGGLLGSANLEYYGSIPGITWGSEWITSTGVQIDVPTWSSDSDPAVPVNNHLNTHVSNLAMGKNYFTLHAFVKHNGTQICEAKSEVLIWNNEVGKVDAGYDDVYCGGDINTDPSGVSNGSYHSYNSDYSHLEGTPLTSVRSGVGVSGLWTVLSGKNDNDPEHQQILFENSTSNVTSVTGLQRYVQECTPDYWDTHTAANVFRWTITYKNPETGEQCSNFDDVQIIWLAPGDPNAGEDQLVCGNDVNLNPLDKGCGAQMTWWDFSGSNVQGNTDNDNTRWANPYWGGRSFVNQNLQDVILDPAEIPSLVNKYGNAGAWYKKDVLVFTDIVKLDDKNYRIQSTRQTYKTSTNAIIHIGVNYTVWECDASGVVADATEDPVSKMLTGGTTVHSDASLASIPDDPNIPGDEHAQLRLYHIADEVFNAAVYDMPSPFERTGENTLSAMTFKWYKHNEMYSQKQKKLISCTSWDEVKVTNLGALNDAMGGGEAATCNDWYDLAAAYDGSLFKDKVAGNFSVDDNVEQWWQVIDGNGFFGESNSDEDRSQKNIRVHQLAFGSNIFRWNVKMKLTFKDAEGHDVNQECSASDDMYVYNATPSVASVGEDREVCDDHTVLSANLPVRGKGTWIPTQGNATVGQSCADQQCDAYITNMSLGPNTFRWVVTNEYKSPKNPTTVYATCTNEDAITLYNHNIKAQAGLDQYICSDEVELEGNDPLSVTSEGMYSSKDGEIVKPTGWWSQASTSKQSFHEFNNESYSNQSRLDRAHVIVKPLSRSMSTFTWNIKWGDCPVKTDDVVVYDNLPDPDPEVPAEFSTCSNFVELHANNHPTYPMDDVNRLEWTSAVSSVTFDGNENKKSNNAVTMAYNLQTGVNNTFTLAFYRTNGDPDPKYKGMPPNILGAYKKAVEDYETSMQAYKDDNGNIDLGRALLDYKEKVDAYTEELEAYNEYLPKRDAYLAYIEALKRWVADPAHNTKPADVDYPEPVDKPVAPVAPIDSSSTNSTDPWAGKGFWVYYVEKGKAAQATIVGGDKYAEICKLSANVVVHSNSIKIKSDDIADCDYYDIVYQKDANGNIISTANNIFVTCASKQDTVNAHEYGVLKHQLDEAIPSFTPYKMPANLGSFSSREDLKTTEREKLVTNFKRAISSETNKSQWYAVLWTKTVGPVDLVTAPLPDNNSSPMSKVPSIDNPAIPDPTLYNLKDGHYEFELYAIRMGDPNVGNGVCEDVRTVSVDIHIPTMAAIEARYQGLTTNNWTIDRTAMCQDNIDMQWMSMNGKFYTPSTKLPEGSTLEPGEIAGIEDGVEYSIFRVLKDDQGIGAAAEAAITFSPNGYTAGSPGLQGIHVEGLPYNGTNFELINCIDFHDSHDKLTTCQTSDTITIFNNSVYADADIHVDPVKKNKGKPGYKWERQEVNICTDEYTLEANDPKGFDGNLSINEYATHSLWGFDDKDFKGYITGAPKPVLESSTAPKTKVTGLWNSDNHQRANAFIWCVYKSIMPPPCNLETPSGEETSGKGGLGVPLKKACTPDTKAYEEDANGNVLYADDQGNEYISKTTDDGLITYISTTDYTTEIGYGIKVKPKELDIKSNERGCLAYDRTTGKCLKFYTYDVIEQWEEINPEFAYKMKVISVLNFLKNSRITVNGGRHNYNYYVTEHKDTPGYIYIWSDRQTKGARVGNNSAECYNIQKDKRETVYFQYIEDHALEGHYFKGASIYTKSQYNTWMPDFNIPNGKYGIDASKYTDCEFITYDGGPKNTNNLPWGWNNVQKLNTAGHNFRSDLETKSIVDGRDLNGVSVADGGYFETWANPLRDVTGVDPGNGKFGSDACTNNCNTAFYIWAMFGYGQPAKIPTSLLKHDANGNYMYHPGTGNRSSEITNFTSKKGENGGCDKDNDYNVKNYLDFDVPLWGDVDNDGVGDDVWSKAWHVTNLKFDDVAIEEFIEGLEKDLEEYAAKTRDPLVSTAITVDEFKEEAENPTKHFWCVDRDTVFIYNNKFYIDDMPNFVVCDENAELTGEDPGAAGDASGKWTIKTNSQHISFTGGKTDADPVTKVTGLQPGENQFNWEVTRWTCKDDADVLVYRNVVVADAGKDVYTCEDQAQLEAVAPSVGEGRWELTSGSTPTSSFDDNTKSDATVTGLVQGDNPYKWVVENPMPKTVEETHPVYDENDVQTGTITVEVLDKINGHKYKKQEPCPKEDDMIVHDLRPDDAVITIGTEVTSP